MHLTLNALKVLEKPRIAGKYNATYIFQGEVTLLSCCILRPAEQLHSKGGHLHKRRRNNFLLLRYSAVEIEDEGEGDENFAE